MIKLYWFVFVLVFEDSLLIVGGESSVGDLLDQIQEYKLTTGKWGIFSTLPFPLSSQYIVNQYSML